MCGLWIMCSNSLHLHRADGGLCRHTVARLKTVWNVFMPWLLLQTRWVFYNLPGDPASALNSAGLVLSGIASSTEGNDADDPSTLGSGISAAHVSKPSAATKVLSVLDYHHYMTHLLATEETTPLSSPGASSLETSPTIKGNVSQAWALS